jgi:hypothetical protein
MTMAFKQVLWGSVLVVGVPVEWWLTVAQARPLSIFATMTCREDSTSPLVDLEWAIVLFSPLILPEPSFTLPNAAPKETCIYQLLTKNQDVLA